MSEKTPEFIVRGRRVSPNGEDLGPAKSAKAEKPEDTDADTDSKPAKK